MKVFLGGTCNGSQWRDELTPLLRIDYYNPITLGEYTPEVQKREIEEREKCDICLYVITPRMMGLYAIAEAVDDSNKRPEKTVICILRSDFGDTKFDSVVFIPEQMQSLDQVARMIIGNGGRAFGSLMDVCNFLNTHALPLVKEMPDLKEVAPIVKFNKEEKKKDDGK